MEIQKLVCSSTMISAITLIVALMFSPAVWAVGVGEVELHSRPGEPLHIRIGVIAEPGEQIENSCLSLAVPDPSQQDAGIFLTKANLSLKADEKRQYVDIKSNLPLNNAFTKLRLQIKCPGVLGIMKTLNIPFQQTSANNEHSSINSSGKITSDELALLLEQQKQLATSFVDMQQKVKLLEGELKGIKLQLVQAGINSSSTPAPAVSAIAGTQEKNHNLFATLKQWIVQQDVLELIAAITLFFLTLWLGLRYYARIKLTSRTGMRLRSSATQVATDNSITSPIGNVSSATRQSLQHNGSHISIDAQSPIANATGKMVLPLATFSLDKNDETVADYDSMLEEASLYAANGRMEKAIEILKEIIGQNPSKEDAWKLLLSIYSALGKATEFERNARNFLKYHKESSSWSGIQVLGRTLDRDNPLYANQDNHISKLPLLPDTLNMHRPIGDVLVEIGALSKQEILKYLDKFDPRLHGRFGGYLVARKAITLAQLDQALLKQQGASSPEVEPAGLPSLQDVEKLLDEFNPKQHGSVIKFLASRNIALPEQLSQYLSQQKNKAAAEKSQPDNAPVFGNLPSS